MNTASSATQITPTNDVDPFGPRQRTIVICEENPVLADGAQLLLQRNPVLELFSISVQPVCDIGILKGLAPDIFIVDPTQGVQSMQLALNAISDLSATTYVICYCPEMSAEETVALSLLGFRGIMPKTVESAAFVRAVCAVAFGGTYVHEVIQKSRGPSAKPSLMDVSTHAVLSEREQEVLRCVAFGRSIKEIAESLKLSAKTVDTYKARAFQKLDLRSRSDAVRHAIELGWMN